MSHNHLHTILPRHTLCMGNELFRLPNTISEQRWRSSWLLRRCKTRLVFYGVVRSLRTVINLKKLRFTLHLTVVPLANDFQLNIKSSLLFVTAAFMLLLGVHVTISFKTHCEYLLLGWWRGCFIFIVSQGKVVWEGVQQKEAVNIILKA